MFYRSKLGNAKSMDYPYNLIGVNSGQRLNLAIGPANRLRRLIEAKMKAGIVAG